MIHLEFEFAATHCNSWPSITIFGNKNKLWQGIVENKQYLDFFIPEETTTITIEGIDKSKGENNIWDTKVDDSGRIIEDKTLTLASVKINNIDMTQSWIDRLSGIRYGVWYENSTVEFTMQTPWLDWVIKTKFIDQPLDRSIIYNNFNSKWNYPALQDRIAVIRNKLNA